MAFETKLIKLVRDKKCLYHTKSRSNTNNQIRVAVWKNISNELGKSVTECKQRWRSLRDRFVREDKKMKQAGTTNEIEQWELYDMMKFLAPSVQKRRQRGVISPNVPDNSSFDESFQSGQSKSKCKKGELDIKEDYVIPDFSYAETVQSSKFKRIAYSPMNSKEVFIDNFGGINTVVANKPMLTENENHLNFETVQSIPSTFNRSSVTFKDSNEAFLDLIERLKTTVDNRLPPEQDENDLFLQCIGKKMKRLSEESKLRIQAKLLANVTEELLKK